jgi:hypothetical protein
VLEEDDRVDHELHEAVAVAPRLLAVLRLASDDAGELVLAQPVGQPIHLAPLGRRVVEKRQEHVDAVEDDPLRAHLADLRREAGEHAREVELSGLNDERRQARVE